MKSIWSELCLDEECFVDLLVALISLLGNSYSLLAPPSLIGIITVVTDEAFPMICCRFFSDICCKALGFRLWHCLLSQTIVYALEFCNPDLITGVRCSLCPGFIDCI